LALSVIISEVPEAMCAERELKIHRLWHVFRLQIVGFETALSVLKTKFTNNLRDGKHSVLWYSIKIVANFMRYL